jgi:myxalamid-type polyketide synthase MxaB
MEESRMFADNIHSDNLRINFRPSELKTGDGKKKPANEPIAIIGIGCRFPGANGPRAYWELLRGGVDVITEVPLSRFDIDAFYDSRPGVPGKLATRWGGFLEQVDQFDAGFFGISPREASRMDPQQRLLLEVTWEALEDAGQLPGRLNGSRTGVFIGMCYNDYEDLELRDPRKIDVYVNAGGARSAASGRLSYAFGLEGTSIVIDTACSSSLVSVHLACQSIRSGESTMAIAGAVNLILQPESSIGFSRDKMLAPDGRCKVFDARANGFVRSEGVGVVILKPFEQARADGDPIYALIRGSATNNDGRSGGFLMTPGGEGQKAVIRMACRNAGILPGQLQYVEAHGTGTKVGDPVEVKALGEVLGEGRPDGSPCVIGSVKANLGHTEAAAGMAGLIKTALCLKYKIIPPSLHFQEPNPNILWHELPLTIPVESMEWPKSSMPAFAGVSAFGLSGTNAHVILEEAPDGLSSYDITNSPPKSYLLALSAHRPELLNRLAQTYREFLRGDERMAPALHNVCYTASLRRDHHEYRLACIGQTTEELARNLEAYLEGDLSSGVSAKTPFTGAPVKIVYVFSGQGSQYLGMGRGLLDREPVFRKMLNQCDQAIRKFAEWSLLEELFADEESSRLDEIDVIQPALFAIQVALAELWRSWGVEPDAIVGHSMGEVAAAYVAGALDLDDAARVICRRSQLMKRTSGQGAMALVELSKEKALQAIISYEDRLSVAADNSPTSTVLSGEPAALNEAVERLEQQGVYCCPVKVDVASHSPQMEPLADELERALKSIRPLPAAIPVCSTVTGEFAEGLLFDARYWSRNLREPVRFSAAIERLCENGYQTFIEISPHPVLTTSIQKALNSFGAEGTVVPSLRRENDECSCMLRGLGELYTMGCPVDFRSLYPSGGDVVELPLYTWQHERYWFETSQDSDNGWLRSRNPNRTDRETRWLGYHFRSATEPDTHLWQINLSLAEFPELEDHRVRGKAVLPAAAYLEITLAAAKEIFGARSHALEQVVFKEALMAPDRESLTVQLALSPARFGAASFKFYSLDGNRGSAVLHASGIVRIATGEEIDCFATDDLIRHGKAKCPEHQRADQHYQAMQDRGLDYGPAFRGIEELWRRDGEAIARLRPPEEITEVGQIDAPLLDACFQTLEAALPAETGSFGKYDCFVPVGLENFHIYRQLSQQKGSELWCMASLRQVAQSNDGVLEGDVLALDRDGRPVFEAAGLRVKRVETSASQSAKAPLGEWFYEVQWRLKDDVRSGETAVSTQAAEPGAWLIFADCHGLGEELAARLMNQGETCQVVFPSLESAGFQGRREEAECLAITGQGERNRYWVCPNDARAIQQVIDEAVSPNHPTLKGIIYLWGAELPCAAETSLSNLELTESLVCEGVMHLIQGLATATLSNSPRLWLVSREAHSIPGETGLISPSQSVIWGLGRVIMLEHPELNCTMIDLGPAGESEELDQLFGEVTFDGGEDQIAFRNGRVYAARMGPRSVETLDAALREAAGEEEAVPISANEQFHLMSKAPGAFDNLALYEGKRQAPRKGEVEIEVLAAGLNFIDVMRAMGIYPGQPLDELSFGIECAGRIVAVGNDVAGFEVGDEVMAVVLSLNAFSAYVTVPAPFVAPKPKSISFEEAATMPIAYLTAYYALHHQGRLARGERVLIHRAAGGVGLAAVQLCQRAGAEIYATAGSPEKRDFLRSLGIKHIYDSRSLAFASEVMRETNREGVDLVLNSLPGEAIQASLELLRDGGRFLEIGKQDIYQNSELGLLPFRRNISFAAIHLDTVLRQRQDLLGELTPYFENGTYPSLPLQIFPVSENASAFRYMAQAKHIGKIALSMRDQGIRVKPLIEKKRLVRSDASYLITGGLGNLGLLTANWLVERGARHLVLMGRGAASNEAQQMIGRLEQSGAEIVCAQGDVGNPEQLARVLAKIEQTMPPLKGVIHAAGVLDDGILRRLTRDRFKAVMAPKVAGAWNLHMQNRSADLDFFVLYSSAAALIGSPGQANYAAGNAFLDGLAHYRKSQSLPALSVNWGPWTTVGMAARPDRGERLASRGVEGITPEQGIAALELLLDHPAAQFAVMPFDSTQWAQFYPSSTSSSLYACLTREKPPSLKGEIRRAGADSVKSIIAAPESERESLMQAYLGQHIAKVLGLTASKTSELNVNQPLNRLGMDSLMALEIKNLIEKSLNISVPMASLLTGSSLADLAKLALDQLSNALLASPDLYGVKQNSDLRPNREVEKEGNSIRDIEILSPVWRPESGCQEWEEVEI